MTAGAVAATVLGAVLLAGLLGWLGRALLRHADRAGILAPVAVGLVLRLVLMLIFHGISLLRHEGGIMFIDDRTYLTEGMHIASRWRTGTIANPAAYDLAGTYMFGFQALIGGAFVLVKNIIAGKLVSVLASAATVFVGALLAGRLWGDETRRRAAWMLALAPGMLWWSVPMMKEAVTALIMTTCVLGLLSFTRPRAGWAAAAVLALLLTRIAAVAAIAAAIPVIPVVALRHRRNLAWRSLVIRGGVAVAIPLFVLLVTTRGDVSGIVDSYSVSVNSMIDRYRGSGIEHVPVSMLRCLVSPYPWVFGNRDTHNWDMGQYPGMWVWYALYPLVGVALWRGRRRPEVLLVCVVLVAYVLVNAFTAGFVFRQRSTIEPVIVVLALGGLRSWRFGVRVAAGAWAVVAIFAAAQSRNPVTVVAILAAAGLAYRLSARVSDEPLIVGAPAALLEQLQRLGRRAPFRLRRRLAAGFAMLRRAPASVAAGRRARWGTLVPLALLVATLSIPVLIGIHTSGGSTVGETADFGAEVLSGVKTRGAVKLEPGGYVLAPGKHGSVIAPLSLAPQRRSRQLLGLLAYGGAGLTTSSALVANGRTVQDLGHATDTGRVFDITRSIAETGPGLRLRVRADNQRPQTGFFLDRAEVVDRTPDGVPGTPTWLLALWAAAVAGFVVAALRLPLPALLLGPCAGLLAVIVWPMARAASASPLQGTPLGFWTLGHGKGWLDPYAGPLAGAYGPSSHLTGQALHTLAPLTGGGPGGAPVGAVLLGLTALTVGGAVACRLAGPAAGVLVALALLATDVFRLGVVPAPEISVLTLAGALYAAASARAWSPSGTRSWVGLGVAGALAVLAEPLAFPGVLLVGAVLLWRGAPAGTRRRAATGFLVTLLLLTAANRVVVADRFGGMLADLDARATAAAIHEGGQPTASPGVLDWVFGDHGPSDLVRGVADGAHDGVRAVDSHSDSGLIGTAILVAVLAGLAFGVVSRDARRLLGVVIVPMVPALFFVGRGGEPAGGVAAFCLPAMLVSAAWLARAVAARAAEAAPEPDASVAAA